MAGFLKKLFGDTSQKEIKKLMPLVTAIEEREGKYAAMTDEELRAQTPALKARLDAGETLEEAVARELSEETGYRLRDDIIPAVRPLPQPGFSSTGLTEENVQVVFAQVEPGGQPRPDLSLIHI